MTDWVNAEERLPEIGGDGKSPLLVFDAGRPIVGRLVQESNGTLWWTPEGCGSQIPEPKPSGVAEQRWVKRWRLASVPT